MTTKERERHSRELTIQFNQHGLQQFPVYEAGLPVRVNGLHLHSTMRQ